MCKTYNNVFPDYHYKTGPLFWTKNTIFPSFHDLMESSTFWWRNLLSINLLVWILLEPVRIVSFCNPCAEAVLSFVLAKSSTVCCAVVLLPSLWLLLCFVFIKNVLAIRVSLPLLLLSLWLRLFDAWLSIIAQQLLKIYSKTWKFTLYRIFINFFVCVRFFSFFLPPPMECLDVYIVDVFATVFIIRREITTYSFTTPPCAYNDFFQLCKLLFDQRNDFCSRIMIHRMYSRNWLHYRMYLLWISY